jgi:hypothetical protein
VVHREQQHTLLGTEPQQARAEERARREVERAPRLLARPAPDRSSTARANPSKGVITCTGDPSTSAKVVRSAS